MAQNPDPDEICIVFDFPDNCMNNCGTPTSGAFNVYVVLQNGIAAGVSGFEFCLVNDDGTPLVPPAGQYFVTGYALPPAAVNVDTPPCFVVGLGTPVAYSSCLALVTINMLSFSTNPWCFGLKPAASPSIPGRMAYAAGDDPGHLIALSPCTGPQVSSWRMACVNDPTCADIVATQDATWGNVKMLYR